jgi:translation initiation factor 1
MKKNKSNSGGIVYSTNPDYQYSSAEEDTSLSSGDEKRAMQIRVWVDRKNRGGKEATIVRGFSGNVFELTSLGKLLKSQCGVGGAVKDGEIIIQGNQREKVIRILIEQGFIATKSAGG